MFEKCYPISIRHWTLYAQRVPNHADLININGWLPDSVENVPPQDSLQCQYLFRNGARDIELLLQGEVVECGRLTITLLSSQPLPEATPQDMVEVRTLDHVTLRIVVQSFAD